MVDEMVRIRSVENGEYRISLNNRYLDVNEITVREGYNSNGVPGAFMMAAALMCSVASCEYELDTRRKGAKYRGIEAFATARKGVDSRKRGVYKSMDLTVRVDVPEEHLAEFEGVVKEHQDNGCTVTRSFNSGYKVSINIERV
jgi:uncharacterized OsmC-like protein